MVQNTWFDHHKRSYRCCTPGNSMQRLSPRTQLEEENWFQCDSTTSLSQVINVMWIWYDMLCWSVNVVHMTHAHLKVSVVGRIANCQHCILWLGWLSLHTKYNWRSTGMLLLFQVFGHNCPFLHKPCLQCAFLQGAPVSCWPPVCFVKQLKWRCKPWTCQIHLGCHGIEPETFPSLPCLSSL